MSLRRASNGGQVPQCPTVVTLLGTLANNTRMAIIRELARAPADVGALAARLGLKTSVTSHHLGRLFACGLVMYRGEKTRRQYRLSTRVAASLDEEARVDLRIATADGNWVRVSVRAAAVTTARITPRARPESLA